MKNMIKDTLILFAITLIAGLGLGVVYNVTKDARASQEEKVKLAAYKEVMPNMKDYKELSDVNYSDVDKEVSKKISENEKNNKISTIKPFNAEINEAVSAMDQNGEEIGYIVTVTDKEAYGGSLQMTVGILKDGTVKGISFLSLNETPGLGMKAKEDSFKQQFKDKKVDFFAYNKAGAMAENEIDAISSATITTNAVTHGVNAAIACADYIQGGDQNE
ncbi:MAG: FMN-binding protein [Eubacterium sp.]|nr:FMN-binding protein [Eubacterium sp.]